MLYASCQGWKAKQLARFSNAGCSDGSTYLQCNENPRCNCLHERRFASSFNPKIRFPDTSFHSPFCFTLTSECFEVALSGFPGTHTQCLPCRSGGSCRHSGFEDRRHCSGQANPNLCHTEGVTAVRTRIVALRMKELAKRGRRKVRERRERQKDLFSSKRGLKERWRVSSYMFGARVFMYTSVILSMCCKCGVGRSGVPVGYSDAWCVLMTMSKLDVHYCLCGEYDKLNYRMWRHDMLFIASIEKNLLGVVSNDDLDLSAWVVSAWQCSIRIAVILT